MENLTGRKFGQLTVLRLNREMWRGRTWVCKCVCGKEIVLSECLLLGTNSRKAQKSCGCLMHKINGYSKKYPQIYNAWKSMQYRCYSPKSKDYKNYGARGIEVCNEWRDSSPTFIKWALNNGYKEHLTIDRKDNNKGYSPSNCQWVTYTEQSHNRRMTSRNTTGIEGVCPFRDGIYRAYITRDGKRKHIGIYPSIKEAAKAREKAMNEYLATKTG